MNSKFSLISILYCVYHVIWTKLFNQTMHMLLGSTLVLTSERQINRQRICNLGVFTLTDVMLLDMNQRKKEHIPFY